MHSSTLALHAWFLSHPIKQGQLYSSFTTLLDVEFDNVGLTGVIVE